MRQPAGLLTSIVSPLDHGTALWRGQLTSGGVAEPGCWIETPRCTAHEPAAVEDKGTALGPVSAGSDHVSHPLEGAGERLPVAASHAVGTERGALHRAVMLEGAGDRLAGGTNSNRSR